MVFGGDVMVVVGDGLVFGGDVMVVVGDRIVFGGDVMVVVGDGIGFGMVAPALQPTPKILTRMQIRAGSSFDCQAHFFITFISNQPLPTRARLATYRHPNGRQSVSGGFDIDPRVDQRSIQRSKLELRCLIRN